MNGEPDDRRRRADKPRWVQPLRGLLLVAGLAVAVGLLGLVLAWIATAVASSAA